MANSTLVTEFLLEVFVELRILFSVLFLLAYLGSLLGNLIIIIVTTVDQTLNTPMYFFLRNLSILDMCYVSVTLPNVCINCLTDHRDISVPQCIAQIFFFFCSCRDSMTVSIPLLYSVIMNYQVCVQMMLASLFSSLAIASVHTFKTFQLFFCHSNVLHQFCDIPALQRLSYSETFNNKLLIMSVIGVGSSCLTFIAISYAHILSTVFKIPVKGE
ncbi:olfactory receptor 14C36-like, partial [Mus caroli]|uniref:Olfactory receptor 14C36-like n=1 Tax=Mus caroli TaxID=10089 RepID=A0A6P5QB89_MUSCR